MLKLQKKITATCKSDFAGYAESAFKPFSHWHLTRLSKFTSTEIGMNFVIEQVKEIRQQWFSISMHRDKCLSSNLSVVHNTRCQFFESILYLHTLSVVCICELVCKCVFFLCRSPNVIFTSVYTIAFIT